MLVRGVCSKRSFSNFGFFLQEDFFETNLDLSKHPEQVFWTFFLFFKYNVLIFVFILVFGELREHCAKFWNFFVNIHSENIFQSRLLLTTFFNCCIVQWNSFSTGLDKMHQRRFNYNICCDNPISSRFHGQALPTCPGASCALQCVA